MRHGANSQRQSVWTGAHCGTDSRTGNRSSEITYLGRTASDEVVGDCRAPVDNSAKHLMQKSVHVRLRGAAIEANRSNRTSKKRALGCFDADMIYSLIDIL